MDLKSCVVLDLDATLVNTFGNDYNWKFVDLDSNKRLKHRVFDIKYNGIFKWGTTRPGTDKFLEACFEHFDIVGVWSAGDYDYVYKIVEEIFPRRPDFIWTRSDCVESLCDVNTDVINGHHIISTSCKKNSVLQKPLEKIFNYYPYIDPKRTLIFDDYLDVCGQNQLYHVHVQAWMGSYESMIACDTTLSKLTKWIKTLSDLNDYKFAQVKI